MPAAFDELSRRNSARACARHFESEPVERDEPGAQGPARGINREFRVCRGHPDDWRTVPLNERYT